MESFERSASAKREKQPGEAEADVTARRLINLLREYYNAKKEGKLEFEDPNYKDPENKVTYKIQGLEEKGPDGKTEVERWEEQLKEASR